MVDIFIVDTDSSSFGISRVVARAISYLAISQLSLSAWEVESRYVLERQIMSDLWTVI